MINKILIENIKILANEFFQTLTNQAHLNSCTVLLAYVIELNIIHIIYNSIAQCNETSRYTLTRVTLIAACKIVQYN
jgi:hypothetical protein